MKIAIIALLCLLPLGVFLNRLALWLARRDFVAEAGEEAYKRVMVDRGFVVSDKFPGFWNYVFHGDKKVK